MELVILSLLIAIYWHFADYLEIRTRSHRKRLQEALAFDDSWRMAEPVPVANELGYSATS